jgi:D-alanyl-D-alanine carboxypeptidase/D-alanyl-D-alanine-endopeptidase (penicillin-binding protein 4)
MAFASLMIMGIAIAQASLTPSTADAYLASLHQATPDYTQRVVAIAKASLGTPYADGPLGEGPGAAHDPDPLIDLSRVDCVTFVEQVLALAAGSTYAEATDVLQQIRYKNGEIDYGTRNHFFIADWIRNNAFARDVTGALGVACTEETRTIGRRKFFELTKAPEYLDGAADLPMTLSYAPESAAVQADAKIPDVALVVFIGKPKWLFASHCGLYVRENGVGMLYHASSVKNEVIAVPFADYVQGNGKIVGFTVYVIEGAKVPRAKG